MERERPFTFAFNLVTGKRMCVYVMFRLTPLLLQNHLISYCYKSSSLKQASCCWGKQFSWNRLITKISFSKYITKWRSCNGEHSVEWWSEECIHRISLPSSWNTSIHHCLSVGSILTFYTRCLPSLLLVLKTYGRGNISREWAHFLSQSFLSLSFFFTFFTLHSIPFQMKNESMITEKNYKLHSKHKCN